jgi:hypothetical protein
MSHSHSFHSWPFNLPVETGVFTTRQVLEGLEPIREVYHDPDGDWQFLCGTTLDAADLKLVCLGCMVERDITIGELADIRLAGAPAGSLWALSGFKSRMSRVQMRPNNSFKPNPLRGSA